MSSVSSVVTYDSLTDEERKQLSKALFPEKYGTKVTLLGVDRELSPIPLKVSKRVGEAIKPLLETFRKALGDPDAVKVDTAVVHGLVSVTRILAGHYGWADVTEAVASEDLGVSLLEMEDLVNRQATLNSVNDFYLLPLWSVIRFLQAAEMATVRVQSLQRMVASIGTQETTSA